MADRVEREIEEILSKLDGDDGGGPSRKPGKAREPIPLRPRRKPSLATRIVGAIPALPAVTPASLLFAGAGIMIVGLILSSFVEALLWLAFVGVIVFLGAFVWAFLRRTTPGPATTGKVGSSSGAYWRDRYIEYEPRGNEPGSIERFKRIFRKR
ncbi:MAG: hypothetical protein R3C29_12290 [Dehalococcoidia bacterium]